MHGFIRATIAVLVSFFVLSACNYLLFQRYGIAGLAHWQLAVFIRICGLFLPIALYALLNHLFPRTSAWQRETLCRRCGYNLRGITEPR